MKMSRDGKVHNIDLDRVGTKDRIFRVGRVPEGSDSDEDKKVKPSERYRKPPIPSTGRHWYEGQKKWGP